MKSIVSLGNYDLEATWKDKFGNSYPYPFNNLEEAEGKYSDLIPKATNDRAHPIARAALYYFIETMESDEKGIEKDKKYAATHLRKLKTLLDLIKKYGSQLNLEGAQPHCKGNFELYRDSITKIIERFI